MTTESQRLEKYNNILKITFGYDSLKKEQFDIIDSIVHYRRDICAILATGFGKSICYQMPFLITKKCVIIVSPLIALMTDQKIEMEKLGIPVTCFNNENKSKMSDINDLIEHENYKLIYITPEYIINCENLIKTLFDKNALALIAIDEAHCVSTWGLDFRKSYTMLGCLRDWTRVLKSDDKKHTRVPIVALTATATEKVRNDIVTTLKLAKPHTILGIFDRPNLYISVKKKNGDIMSDIGDLLEKFKNEYMIIYCKTINETEKVAETINKYTAIKCEPYHAKLDTKLKNVTQTKFINGELKCIVATIAFGMGINIKNIRLVLHYNCPKNLESYYQEIGRAGRDGNPSECHLFYSGKDFSLNRFLIKDIADQDHKNYMDDEIKKIEKYVYSHECRRKLLLKSFDEKLGKDECSNCDICTKNITNTKNKVDLVDYTTDTFIIMYLLVELTNNYGMATIIDILRGSKNKKINGTNLQTLNMYGAGKYRTAEWWKSFIRILTAEIENPKKNSCVGFIKENKFYGNKGFGSVLDKTDRGLEWIKNMISQYGGSANLINVDNNMKIYLEKI